MPQYTAIFVTIDGLSEEDFDTTYRLDATEREDAKNEALQLPRPDGANFIKLIRDGQYERPKLGLDF